jgi:GNAT superfamily N-acetyltransferase
MVIRLLADASSAVEPLARAMFDEWPGVPGQRTLEDTVARYRECCRRDGLPLALVALDGRDVAGTVGLRADSVSTRPDLAPWLAAFWVAPPRRGRGLGARLVRAAEDEARRLGIPTLHAGTSTAGRLFERLGWRAVDRTPCHGEDLGLYRWDASSARGRVAPGRGAAP